jgi:hypothetical protein
MRRFSHLAKFSLTFVLLALAFGADANAGINHLSPDVQADLQRKHDFVILKKVADIPAAGLTTFRASQDGKDFRMAEPGEKFQSPSNGPDAKLPPRQLVFAALSNSYLLIEHARGDYALGYYFVLMRNAGHQYKVIWVGEGARCSSYRKFLKGLKSGAIDDRPGYAY